MWALDEALDREVPLSLLYAIDEAAGKSPSDAAADVAAAEGTVRDAIATIEALGKHLKVEADIVHRRPAAALVAASRSAAMVCVGSIGLDHAVRGPIGATASALLASARCPVAVVPRTAVYPADRTGLVLAVVDDASASDRVLELSVAEARLRAAPLRIFELGQPCHPRPDEMAAPPARQAVDELERAVAHWREKQPDLTIDLVNDHNGLLNYLEHLQRTTTPIQLIVVGPQCPGPVDTLLGASGGAALEAAGCTLLVCDRMWWL